MALRTYGKLIYDGSVDKFIITSAEPHVCIKLKNIFPKIPVYQAAPYKFENRDEVCADLLWFTSRYPLEISSEDLSRLKRGESDYITRINEMETIMLPTYQPGLVTLKKGFEARDYQLRANETYIKCKRLLLGDDIGLGKTLTATLSFLQPETLPAIVVVQTHMTNQWKVDGIEKFTTLKCHIINKTQPYNLPPADVYILKYSCLAGWTNIFTEGLFKSAVFDEVQELRRHESKKYKAGKVLAAHVNYAIGLSATPIYNYGDEIFNIIDLLNPDSLGRRDDFLREWAVRYGNNYKVTNPKALGTYLRERFLFLRRTRQEVGRELPPVNKIIHTVGYDEKEVRKAEDIAKQLAMKVMHGSFEESGQAARELDILARYTTGISKAREVAEYVKILLENDEPVVLAGWHRDVYNIWLEELKDYYPVMYTGTESASQKEAAKEAFVTGKTNLFIISLRSGAGLDGLQYRCNNVVLGELDWSPKVHDQLIGRVDRDGREGSVTAHFLVSEYGSDPVIINLLGLKASQAKGIVDPLSSVENQHSDDSRLKELAKQYLNKQDTTLQSELWAF